MNKILINLLVVSVAFSLVNAHGWLDQPPNRASAWRYDSRFPAYYQDQSLYCGDSAVMMNSVNKGRCGICGEIWSEPKELEKGGKYYRGWIVKTYSNKDIIEAKYEFYDNPYANHHGAFEFRLCNVDTMPDGEATQECLDKLLLKDINGKTFIMNPSNSQAPAIIKLKIPEGFTCKHCVLQSTWYTEHRCDGVPFFQCVYKSKQTFKHCADIQITSNPLPVTQAPVTQPSTTKPSGQVASLFQQCGGVNWSGPTNCEENARCFYLYFYYSICIPNLCQNTVTQAPTTPSSTPKSSAQVALLFQQCGGIGWSGPTSCEEKATCHSLHSYYSICIPNVCYI